MGGRQREGYRLAPKSAAIWLGRSESSSLPIVDPVAVSSPQNSLFSGEWVALGGQKLAASCLLCNFAYCGWGWGKLDSLSLVGNAGVATSFEVCVSDPGVCCAPLADNRCWYLH